jgi:fused signal recognition particle receptor
MGITGFFSRLFSKTKQRISSALLNAFGKGLNEETIEEIEEILYNANFGIDLSTYLTSHLRKYSSVSPEERMTILKDTLCGLFDYQPLRIDKTPTLIYMIGVNGNGKTTSAAKLASYLVNTEKRSPVLVAADTFRSAAIDQLNHWADQTKIPCLSGRPNSDPSGVIYDACKKSVGGVYDTVIVDTAGRWHNNHNLNQELKKMIGVGEKLIDPSNHVKLLVVDANSGHNALEQAKHFNDAVGIDGIVLTKVDGTTKGGMAAAIAHELSIPIYFVGYGEGIADWAVFDKREFVDGIL